MYKITNTLLSAIENILDPYLIQNANKIKQI